MAIIKPLNAFTVDDTTSDNFPALKYAWLPGTGLTTTTWTDAISGLVCTTESNGLSQNAAGAVIQSGAGVCTSSSTTITKPGTTDVVLISVGYYDSNASIEIGDSTATQGIGVYPQTTNNFVTSDDGDYATIGPAHTGNIGSSGSPGAFGISIDWSADEAKSFNATSAGAWTLNAAGAITLVNDQSIADGLSALGTEKIKLPLSPNAETYGVYILYFTAGVPADLAQAVQWMVANPTKGVYPGWIGIS